MLRDSFANRNGGWEATRAPATPVGGSGLAVATSKTTRASLAEFDDFVVEPLA